ncbi:MAG TPA: CvpA family protein, partial [Acidimicrobiia bacterium]|nr:CvpA family protein [Acidimicrobiia bacterium]
MIDFVLGLALAAMLVRGWMRGFVREALDLVGLVVGLWLAFRLSAPFGDFLTDSFGVSPEVGRVGGGIALFVLFGAVLSIAAHYLSKVMNLPGLSMVNRVGGAAVAIGWGVLIVLVVVSLIAVLPVPASWRDQLDESNVVALIAGEDAVPRRAVEALAGDNVMAAIASLQRLFGASRVVPEGDEVLEFPPANADEIRQVRPEAERVLAHLNEDRVGVGLRAVTAVAALTDLAEEHAAAGYTQGRLQRLPDCAVSLAQRSYQVAVCDNAVALAGTALAGYTGIYESVDGRTTIETPMFDRAGVAVVDGPTGRLVVVVLA